MWTYLTKEVSMGYLLCDVLNVVAYFLFGM